MNLRLFTLCLCMTVLICQLISGCGYLEESAPSQTGQVCCAINLNKSLLEYYAITDISLSIKRDGTTIWGPRLYTIADHTATINGVPLGQDFRVYARIDDIQGDLVCDGYSEAFDTYARQTADAGFIILECAGALYASDAIVGELYLISATAASAFQQGSPDTEPCRHSDERQFTHILNRDFAVMATEVTRQMWSDLRAAESSLPADPSQTSISPAMDYPVQQVMWSEVILFANLLSGSNGFTRCYYQDPEFTTIIDGNNYKFGPYYCDFSADGYRLPSEGEWEYMCRGGSSGPFFTTESEYNSGKCGAPYCTADEFPMLEQNAVFCANSSAGASVSGSKLPNPWNVKDVHGNVWEWCWDWYGKYPRETGTNYAGPATGQYRVTRGGAFNAYALDCRSAARGWGPPDVGFNFVGFRLCRTVDW
ncbi:formylglycine-generating enzyme family protein [candidate division CSSED10-310 bacterium]|uniref:Formylglycine-generating enzyme family protein n=1 Tax=candidate division CSSED10-310 bacterium TaxID=2855610 RepID=A0ABV6YUC7_UNCC1